MTRAEQNRQAAIDAALEPLVGPPPPADANPVPGDFAGIRTLLRIMLGQAQIPTTLNWLMSLNRSATRLDMLETQFAALQGVVAAKFADLTPRLALAEAALTQAQAALAANYAADRMRDAKDELISAATEANRLDVAALKLQEASNQAALAALQARATSDEAAIATTQAAATAAQTTATQARAEAKAAQDKADAQATATLAAKTVADTAQATATAAQVALSALAARFRTKRLPTPPVGVGATMTINVVWDTPFADDKYNAVAEFEGLSVLGLTAVVTNRTATGCTVTSKNVLGLALLAGAGTVTITAIHDQA